MLILAVDVSKRAEEDGKPSEEAPEAASLLEPTGTAKEIVEVEDITDDNLSVSGQGDAGLEPKIIEPDEGTSNSRKIPWKLTFNTKPTVQPQICEAKSKTII